MLLGSGIDKPTVGRTPPLTAESSQVLHCEHGLNDRQRWTRVPPALAWKHPGLSADWVPVLERNPEALAPEPLPGCVGLDAKPRRLHVWSEQLEFRDSGQI